MLGLSQIQMSNDNKIRNTGLSLTLSYLWDPCMSYYSSQVTRLGVTFATTHPAIL